MPVEIEFGAIESGKVAKQFHENLMPLRNYENSILKFQLLLLIFL